MSFANSLGIQIPSTATTVDSLYSGHPCVHDILSTVDRVSTLGRVMNSLKFWRESCEVENEKMMSLVTELELKFVEGFVKEENNKKKSSITDFFKNL